ncbi:hypothetical protein P3X46_007995 [Hevea brasiliensis]|uniref:Transcription repressor n=1 Tax=Hevea brasiliensis TaxID=3981 RepID=A0ABQ9MKK9_HEVBR|nr:transcription repressor OFP3 isoform X2 [Hevea brasiliensis]KAJ9179646.1 hypothetical protein P3X46_007995 [Hevea brasiliensis]
MGNYRFRLSDMMPNAWFYKLKEMGRTRNHTTTSTHSMKKKQPITKTSADATSAAGPLPSKPKQTHHHQCSYPRKSYYFTRELIPTNPKSTDTHFHDPPRRSSKQRLLKRRTSLNSSSPKLVTSSVSAGCSCGATIWTKSSDSPPDYSASSSDSPPELELSDSFPPEFRSDRALETQSFDSMVAWSSSCGCNVDSNADDIIIDVDKKSFGRKFDKLDLSDLDLPPIIAKPAKFDDKAEDVKKKETKETTKYRKSSAKYEETNAHGSLSVKVVKEESVTTNEHKGSNSLRRHSVNSPGLRLRVNSPRIASRRIQAHARKSVSSTSSSSYRRSLSDSLAIVKSSFDPQRDFRDSMVEMIMENNIRASKDLEDLLACYLSLNSDEYHDLIIKVFKQIWFDLTEAWSNVGTRTAQKPGTLLHFAASLRRFNAICLNRDSSKGE